MSSNALYGSLLRPIVLQILRAAGFQAARPAVVDTLVDLTIRYLMLLGQATASYSMENHNDLTPTILDVRSALQDVGALRPQINNVEEYFRGAEDMRGIEAFLAWIRGDVNKEIRRIAGLIPSEGEVVTLDAGEAREDFLTGDTISSYFRDDVKLILLLQPSRRSTARPARSRDTRVLSLANLPIRSPYPLKAVKLRVFKLGKLC